MTYTGALTVDAPETTAEAAPAVSVEVAPAEAEAEVDQTDEIGDELDFAGIEQTFLPPIGSGMRRALTKEQP